MKFLLEFVYPRSSNDPNFVFNKGQLEVRGEDAVSAYRSVESSLDCLTHRITSITPLEEPAPAPSPSRPILESVKDLRETVKCIINEIPGHNPHWDDFTGILEQLNDIVREHDTSSSQ